MSGWRACQQVARTRIARTANVGGLTSNEALALYEGAHRAPLSWIDDRHGAERVEVYTFEALP